MTAGIGVRLLEGSRLALGLVYLVAPSVVMGADSESVAGRRVAVLIGVRYVLQSAVLRVLDVGALHRLGGWVDAAHAASMAGWWLGSTRHQRIAARQAAQASVFAILELAISRGKSTGR